MRYIITFSLLGTLLISCGDKQEKSVSYFGGEIINPNSKYVFLYKNDQLVDSSALDENNRFLIELNDLEEGLYHFEHKPEYQYVFIEKEDSILIRLNTYDFDESLVFTGKGAEKNNFLIDMYLVNEDEERLIYNYYKLEANEFRRKTDSLLAMKMEEYENLLNDYNLSEAAENITRASIDYAHYISMELYPYMHKRRNNLDKTAPLQGNFYAYRETLDNSDGRLSHFRPYFNYMVMKMNNLSYVSCDEECDNDSVAIEETFHYHVHKLHLIDSLVEDDYLRKNLYRNTAYSYLLGNHHPEDNKLFIDKFSMFSESEEHIAEISKLYKSKQNLAPGKPLPEFSLMDTGCKSIDIRTVYSDTKKVFYFWSLNQRRDIKNISKRVKKLQEKYPSYTFIGINVNESQEKWLKHIKAYQLDPRKQFRTENFPKLSEKLIINNLNKAIITEGDGTIINAFTNIYRKSLEVALEAQAEKKELY